jgi:hypothetical protein
MDSSWGEIDDPRTSFSHSRSFLTQTWYVTEDGKRQKLLEIFEKELTDAGYTFIWQDKKDNGWGRWYTVIQIGSM